MSPKPRRSTVVPEREIKRQWGALGTTHRLGVLRFDDPILVERIRSSLQELFTRQKMMIRLGLLRATEDPFAGSSLLNNGFIYQDATMLMKEAYVGRDKMLHDLHSILPDFLSQTSGRTPIPQARWKELWATEPPNVQALERQLVKLIEQALWAMFKDSTYGIPAETNSQPLVDALEGSTASYDLWMEESGVICTSTKKKAHSKKKGKNCGYTSFALDAVFEQDEERTPKSGEYTKGEARDSEEDETKQEELKQEKKGEDEQPKAYGHHLLWSNSADDNSSCGTPRRETESNVSSCYTTHDPSTSCSSVDHFSLLAGEFDEASQVASNDEMILQAESDQTVSRDESVGLGKLNFGLVDSNASHPCQSRWPVTPRDYSGNHRQVDPPSLVCYIWSQTSALEQGTDQHTASGEESPFSRRGQWMRCEGGTPQSTTPKCILRKTFVEVEEDLPPSEIEERRARSLSPSWLSLCDRYWYQAS